MTSLWRGQFQQLTILNRDKAVQPFPGAAVVGMPQVWFGRAGLVLVRLRLCERRTNQPVPCLVGPANVT
jgi:hypothetical protein